MNSNQHVRFFYLIFVLLASIILGFFIFRPFIAEIFLALVLVVIARPLHHMIIKIVPYRGLSAFVTTCLVLLFIIVPVSLVGTLLVKETLAFASSFNTSEGSSVIDAITRVDMFLGDVIPYYEVGILSPDTSAKYLEQAVGWFASNIQGIFSNILEWFISTIIVLFALYYLFKDGDALYEGALATSPLDDEVDKKIGKEITSIIQAVISGRIIIGVVQGAAAYVGFLFFGIGNPLLLAVIVTVLAVLPMVGPMVVIIPVALYQFAVGETFSAVGLISWGILIVGVVDDWLGSVLIHSKTNIHPFVVLVSILGGFHIFGPIGFVAGPVVVGVVFALFRMLPLLYEEFSITPKRRRTKTKATPS